MRLTALYLRSRRVPVALIATAGIGVGMWSLWSVFSDSRDVDGQLVVLTILLLVAALTATLGGPDDAMDGTAGFSWHARRIAHLGVAFLVVVAVLLVSYGTGARFGPAWVVVRDAGGLLGLTALGAAVVGTGRAWFLPLGWTLFAIVVPQSGPLLGRVLTWQMQPPESTAAMVTAGVLVLAGIGAYGAVGPARRAPAEAAQS